jgi:glycosyltransferase involved in cell wall biosynthesis
VTTIPETFGAFLVPYAQHFRRRGWQVDIASGAGTLSAGARAAVDHVIEIPWSRSFNDRRNFTKAVAAFRTVMREHTYDIVHVHTPIAAASSRAALATIRRVDRPHVVYTAHGFHFGTGRSWLREVPFVVAEWLAGRVTDELIVINETDQRNAERLRIVPSGRIDHLPGIGLDLDWYDRSPALLTAASRLRHRLDLEDGVPLFSIVAGLHPGKGHIGAVRALAVMRRNDAHLALAGTGVLDSDIEAEAHRLGVAGRVHFLGAAADVRPLLLASRASVLPSVREGRSRAVLESLALGVPVVGSDIRGIAESVGADGGLLVPVGDVRALAGALDAVAERPIIDEPTRARIRHRLEPCSIEALLRRHEAIYGHLLAGAGR